MAVILPAIIPSYSALWSACLEEGADVTLVGTNYISKSATLLSAPGIPPGMPTILLKPWKLLADHGFVWYWYRRLRSAIREIRPDVVHLASEPWGLLVLQVLAIRALGRVKFRLCVHGADNIYHHGSLIEQRIRTLVLHFVLPRIDAFLSINGRGIELAREAGLPLSVPAEVVFGSLRDPSEFGPPASDAERSQIREKLGLPIREIVVGLLGRLVPEKGVDDAIEAIGGLSSDGRPFLAIWGRGPLEAFVREALTAGRIRGAFHSPLPSSDVANALKACDIILVPSKSTPAWVEQFGRIAMEAQLCGCAVIAYRSGELPRVVGDGGILVDEGDVRGLREALEALLRDQKQRLQLASRGRAHALEHYHPRVQAKIVVGLWTRLAERTGRDAAPTR